MFRERIREFNLCSENEFDELKRNKESKRQPKTTTIMLKKTLKKLKPVELSRHKSNFPLVHVYSDASLEGDQTFIGGIVMLRDKDNNYQPKSLMLQVFNIPNLVYTLES